MRHPSVISVCATLTTAGSVGAPRENSRSTCGITTAKSPSMSTETTSLPKITTKQMADQSQAGSTSYFADAAGHADSGPCFRRVVSRLCSSASLQAAIRTTLAIAPTDRVANQLFRRERPAYKRLGWWLLLYSRCGKKAL